MFDHLHFLSARKKTCTVIVICHQFRHRDSTHIGSWYSLPQWATLRVAENLPSCYRPVTQSALIEDDSNDEADTVTDGQGSQKGLQLSSSDEPREAWIKKFKIQGSPRVPSGRRESIILDFQERVILRHFARYLSGPPYI